MKIFSISVHVSSFPLIVDTVRFRLHAVLSLVIVSSTYVCHVLCHDAASYFFIVHYPVDRVTRCTLVAWLSICCI